MCKTQPAENWSLSHRGQEYQILAKPTVQQLQRDINELEALLYVINMSVSELSQPMTVILGLSELLQNKLDNNDALAADLTTISKQISRMGEIIKGINRLSDEKLDVRHGHKRT